MEHIRLQASCLVVLIYIAFIYLNECRIYRRGIGDAPFFRLLVLGFVSVILDGATAFTVNHREAIPTVVNDILHALFLLSIDLVIFALFLYMLHITGTFPESRRGKMLICLPFAINAVVVVCNIHTLEYIDGAYTDYSMGVSAYTCFIMAAVYIVLTLGTFLRRWNYIAGHKRASIFTYLLVLAAVTTVQMIFPETLITCVAVTVMILGVYMNTEAPALQELSKLHTETVMGFANLIENRDNNTGGHIKRTSRYVELIAEELRARDICSSVLTKDYITHLCKAAPMHDIGKVAVSDAVLRKPGKLTDEEYNEMKTHAARGGDIIRETFRNMGDEDYRTMAFEVARYHHEKWNGRGYPDGLSGTDIPLCARIMAVADVFDAVSEKRCYRDAMPLDKCFDIIRQGSGEDFDPQIVEVFLDIRSEVEKVHSQFAVDKDIEE